MSKVQSYEYDELLPGQSRVVEFLPSSDRTIRCRIIKVSIDANDGVPYDALSYTWGGQEKTESINIEGRILPITWNLSVALRNLRDHHKRLWIDAICINQNDFKERELQVREMAKIYQRAVKVVIWLGAATPDTDALMGALEILEKEFTLAGHDWEMGDSAWLSIWHSIQTGSGDTHRNHDLISKQQEGLRYLMEYPWFMRIWIVQEVAFARATVVCCGAKRVSGEFFSIAPSLVDVKVGQHQQTILDRMSGFPRQFSWWGQPRDLLTMLRKFRLSQASEPRDRVYALINLCSEKTLSRYLSPNYRTTDVEVVREVLYMLFGFGNRESTSTLEDKLIQACPTISAMIENLDMLESQAPMVWELDRPRELLVDESYLQMPERFRGSYGPARYLNIRTTLIRHETVAICAAGNERGYITMHMLLQEYFAGLTPDLAKEILVAAAKNDVAGGIIIALLVEQLGEKLPLDGTSLRCIVAGHHTSAVRLMLDRYRNYKNIREDALFMALQYKHFDTAQAILQQHGQQIAVEICEISPTPGERDCRFSVTVRMMRPERQVYGLDSCEELDQLIQPLLTDCGALKIAEQARIEIVRGCSPATVQLLINRCGETFGPEAAVLSTSAQARTRPGMLKMLFEQYGEKIRMTSAVLEHVTHRNICTEEELSDIVRIILYRHGSIDALAVHILNLCIDNGKDKAGLIVLDHIDYKVEKVDKFFQRTLKRPGSGNDLLEALFKRRSSKIDISTDLFCEILRSCWPQTVKALLSRKYGEVWITISAFKAAADNDVWGKELLSLLYYHCTPSASNSEKALLRSLIWALEQKHAISGVSDYFPLIKALFTWDKAEREWNLQMANDHLESQRLLTRWSRY